MGETKRNVRKQPRIAVIVSCFGLAIDFYDFTLLNVVKTTMESVYGEMTAVQNSTLSVSSMVGALTGMIFFGALGDCCGRRKMFIVCALLTCLGAALSAVAFNPDICTCCKCPNSKGSCDVSSEHYDPECHENPCGVYWVLTAFRLLMGFGFGGLLAPSVVLVLMLIDTSDEMLWRVAFGVGALVSLVNAVLRICYVENSDSYQKESTKERSFARTCNKICRYWYPLVGTMGAWFLYDLVDYGLALFSAEIAGSAGDLDAFQEVWSVLMYALMALPGALLAVCIVPFFGRKQTYIVGTVGMLAI